jgi:hypothetical protein
LSCNQTLRIPTARVAIRLLDAIAVECELRFFVASVEQGPEAQNEAERVNDFDTAGLVI